MSALHIAPNNWTEEKIIKNILVLWQKVKIEMNKQSQL